MKVWLNGDLVEADHAHVSVFDHGLTVGDGVFETMKVSAGRPFAITRHLRRLVASAAAMGLPLPDPGLAAEAIWAACGQLDPTLPGRVRLTWTAGAGPLGSGRGAGPATMLAVAGELPAPAASEAVLVVPWRRNERSAVAGVKTTSYAENVLALARAREAGAGEALFLNCADQLCEGTGTNVFCVHQGQVSTPPLSSGCLAGITRELVLAWVPVIRERALTLEDLYGADEVFLTSSTREVQPVHAVDGRLLGVDDDGEPAPCPGPMTDMVTAVFAERSAIEPDPI